MEEDCGLAEDFDCPSLLCEELEDLETKYPKEKTSRGKDEGDEKVLNQRDYKETGEELEHEESNEGEEKGQNKVVVSEKKLMEKEEVEEVKPESGLEAEGEEVAAQDAQMKDKEADISKQTVVEKQESKIKKVTEKKNEQKKSRRRRGKKQNEHVRTRKGGKEDFSEKLEEEKISEMQEMSVMSSEENSALFEASVGLMNSFELSDPVYLGIGTTGQYCPPVSVPILYSSQPPVPIQSAAPQSHGTKRPHSPSQPCCLPQQSSHTLQ
ncbi:hypothetical protein AMECASPLE_031215, partial [Ameca splendens]